MLVRGSRPFVGRAIAATTGRSETQPIARLQGVCELGVVDQLIVDPDLAGGAGTAADDAGRRRGDALGIEAKLQRRGAQHFDIELLAEAAAMTAGATGAGAQH